MYSVLLSLLLYFLIFNFLLNAFLNNILIQAQYHSGIYLIVGRDKFQWPKKLGRRVKMFHSNKVIIVLSTACDTNTYLIILIIN